MKLSFSAFVLSFSLLVATGVQANPADERFLAAREAFRIGDRAKLERIAPELKGHELEAYVPYWRMLSELKDADPATVRAYLSRNEKSYLADRLRFDWLKQLGRKRQWREFDAEYPQLSQPDQELACYALQSRQAGGDVTALDDAMTLWLSLLEPTEPCYPVLESLIYERRVLADEVWARVRRQFEGGKLAAARYTMNYLPASQTPDVKLAETVSEKPLPWLVKLPSGFGESRMMRELAALAIQRVARTDPKLAAEQMARIENRLQPGERGWAWGQIALEGARRHLPEALAWYRQAGDTPLSEEPAQWKVRAALRVQDWATVRKTIEKMPPALAAQPDWVYWLGRALRTAGRTEEANALFAKISGLPNFYGNLADDELNRPINPPPKARVLDKDEVAQVAANPGIRRALAMFRMNLRFEGTKEWSFALRGMSDRELLAASDIAHRAGIYDRAIAAADRTKSEHDYSLRYLTPFSEQIRPAAKNQSLDDAWVYGLMRQESRFITNAKSTVGASGLMQLMPATAKWVANKIGLRDFHQGRVNETDVNVLLGTTYMRLVLESLDNHPVLASAAYNAGPGRARRWRTDQSMEGAIYAETIPFTETRDYVKKVMSNAVYYSALFDGTPQSLKKRLGMIPARTGGEPKREELP